MTTNLALDLGVNTGFAIWDNDKNIIYGTKIFSCKESRYFLFYNWLKDIYNTTNGIDYICYEKVYRHMGSSAAHLFGYFEGIILLFSYKYNIKIKFCSPSEISKFAKKECNSKILLPIETLKKYKLINKITNKISSKQYALKFVLEKGLKPQDNNASDAITILYLCT